MRWMVTVQGLYTHFRGTKTPVCRVRAFVEKNEEGRTQNEKKNLKFIGFFDDLLLFTPVPPPLLFRGSGCTPSQYTL